MALTPQTPVARLSTWFMRRTTLGAVRRVAPLNAAVGTDLGAVREENQDRVALARSSDRNGSTFILAALADGIGGMKRGGECASVALGTFIESVLAEAHRSPDPEDWLRRACLQANQAVHARYAGDGGSTLSAVLMTRGHRPLWLNVGDSRVYHAVEGNMSQLSRDDTLEGQLGRPIEGGRRSELLQFVGIGENLDPHIETMGANLTGTMLLTSDGVHFVDSTYLSKVVQFAPDLGVCVRRLIELAKFLGGPDNASVAALSVDALNAELEPYVDSCLEVWDPFGELHLIFDRGFRRDTAPASIADSPVAEAKTPQGDTRQAQGLQSSPPEKVPVAAAVNDGAPKPKTRKKAKSGRKTKAEAAKAKHEVSDGGEAPQFLIEFPRKGP